jgi:Peptidase family M28
VVYHSRMMNPKLNSLRPIRWFGPAWLLVVWALVAYGADRPPVPPLAERICPLVITPEQVRPHVEYLASPELGGRDGEGATLASEYVAKTLREAGLQPLFGSEYFQPIPDSVQPDGSQPVIARNVGAIWPGSDPLLKDEVILLAAHYDHLGMRRGKLHPGADDNASGVAMLLETARYVSTLPEKPRRSIAFVGFDMEEELLYGSRWFVGHPPLPLDRIKLMVTADLIGRSLGDLPLPLVFLFGSEYSPELRTRLAEVGTPSGLEVGRLGVDFIGNRSDYVPFRDQRIPFLFFSTGEHPDYHTPRDTPDRIEYDKLARISSVMAQLMVQVANQEKAPAWNSKPEPDLEEARTMERVTQVMLAEEAAGRTELSATVRFVAGQTLAKTRYMRERGTLTADERVWLRRSAQFLLLSAF